MSSSEYQTAGFWTSVAGINSSSQRPAKKAGFGAVHIEPNGNVVELAQSASQVPVLHSFFPSLLPKEKSFAAITFNDVLEHKPDAAHIVEESRSRLLPGGLLVLNFPSSAGLFYKP